MHSSSCNHRNLILYPTIFLIPSLISPPMLTSDSQLLQSLPRSISFQFPHHTIIDPDIYIDFSPNVHIRFQYNTIHPNQSHNPNSNLWQLLILIYTLNSSPMFSSKPIIYHKSNYCNPQSIIYSPIKRTN